MARKGKVRKRATRNAVERPERDQVHRYIQFFLIICEDQKTERIYFERYENLFPDRTLFLKVIGTGKDPLGVVEESLITQTELETKARKKIDFVWAVFDKDDADLNEARIQRFEKAFEIAEREGIHLAFSNEVFELWLLLHLTDVNSCQPIPRKDIYKMLQSEIRKHGGAYKSFKYQHGNADILEVICTLGDEAMAISRAAAMLDFHQSKDPIQTNPSTRVHELILVLNDWVEYHNYPG